MTRRSPLLLAIAITAATTLAAPADYFVIHVTDEATGRGVPLIELKLPNEVKYFTDSAGIAALHEPSFATREVFVHISGHGYQFAKDGIALTLKPGGRAEIKVRRTIIAERLYRLTG